MILQSWHICIHDHKGGLLLHKYVRSVLEERFQILSVLHLLFNGRPGSSCKSTPNSTGDGGVRRPSTVCREDQSNYFVGIVVSRLSESTSRVHKRWPFVPVVIILTGCKRGDSLRRFLIPTIDVTTLSYLGWRSAWGLPVRYCEASN